MLGLTTISASILAASHVDLKGDVEKLEKFGADVIHVDIMDGHYVKNLTFGPKTVEGLKKITSLPIDVHLEMYRQEEFIDSFIDAGADVVTLQYESCEHPLRAIEKVKERGRRVSLAIAPMTDITMLMPYLHELDEINLMTVDPGFGGQKLRKEVLIKMNYVNQYIMKEKLSTIIAVDGGVNNLNIQFMMNSGVTNFVIGNMLFQNGEVQENINLVKEAIQKTLLGVE